MGLGLGLGQGLAQRTEAYVVSAWRANEEPSKRLVSLFCRSSRWRSLRVTPAAR